MEGSYDRQPFQASEETRKGTVARVTGSGGVVLIKDNESISKL
ncbi:MAG: hypothetical protein GQF41_4058 [Candidatus Rifleibacterium amylolyticum]|nr:MAG: hypothetical protein GQF41_4058 [Candidatus Rifleibacterium amylolyticum]